MLARDWAVWYQCACLWSAQREAWAAESNGGFVTSLSGPGARRTFP